MYFFNKMAFIYMDKTGYIVSEKMFQMKLL